MIDPTIDKSLLDLLSGSPLGRETDPACAISRVAQALIIQDCVSTIQYDGENKALDAQLVDAINYASEPGRAPIADLTVR